MHARKIDYRIGRSPESRIRDCQNAIRDALRKGKKTFGGLLDATDMSRSTLAFHLKEMHKKSEVEREMDPKDYRITYYSLTGKGKVELRRQEDINDLSSADLLHFSKIANRFADALARALKFLEPSIQQYILSMEDQDLKHLKKCITYSIYSDSQLSNKIRDYARELAELAATSMLSKIALSTQRHARKEITNISLVFKLDIDKIDKYLKKLEDELDEEPIRIKLPDIKDYLKKKKRNGRTP